MWHCFDLSVQISLSPSAKSIMLKHHIVSSICWCEISYTAVCSSAVFGPNTGWKSKYLETLDILRPSLWRVWCERWTQRVLYASFSAASLLIFFYDIHYGRFSGLIRYLCTACSQQSSILMDFYIPRETFIHANIGNSYLRSEFIRAREHPCIAIKAVNIASGGGNSIDLPFMDANK